MPDLSTGTVYGGGAPGGPAQPWSQAQQPRMWGDMNLDAPFDFSQHGIDSLRSRLMDPSQLPGLFSAMGQIPGSYNEMVNAAGQWPGATGAQPAAPQPQSWEPGTMPYGMFAGPNMLSAYSGGIYGNSGWGYGPQ